MQIGDLPLKNLNAKQLERLRHITSLRIAQLWQWVRFLEDVGQKPDTRIVYKLAESKRVLRWIDLRIGELKT
jgi:hypothetical protein